MKIVSVLFVLLGGAYGAALAARAEILPPVTTTVDDAPEDEEFDTFANHGGWVNPEDLLPMPQCIAQQDQSPWLNTMTECTSKICINLCTRHQWLTRLSCLSVKFSPDVIRGYLPHCRRSVLAEAQLYAWVRKVTGRTWLADVGDTNGLQKLSPASLAKGYAAVDVVLKAPGCLLDAASGSSGEAFPHAMASCGFTSTSEHTGNVDRPWEYDERSGSMMALDSVTAGYDIMGRYIPDGDYFDRNCFCRGFTLGQASEPCSSHDSLDLTRQRLWMNATCGPTSLPVNWTNGLRTIGFAYMPHEGLTLPMCFARLQDDIIDLASRCTTDACEVGSNGYCNIRSTIDRSCLCSGINYDDAWSPCHFFERRIDYVQWLHNLCGRVPDWHGLPDNWRQLTVPTTLEMLPWKWMPESRTQPGSGGSAGAGDTFTWRVASLAVLNAAPFLALNLTPLLRKRFSVRGPMHSGDWITKMLSSTALYLLGTSINVVTVTRSPGYKHVPAMELFLLWNSMPRTTWLATLITCLQAETIRFSLVAGALVTEWILQVHAAYYLILTVNYGFEHGFYSGWMEKLDSSTAAKTMYAGALLWLSIAVISLVVLVKTVCGPSGRTEAARLPAAEGPKDESARGKVVAKPKAELLEQWVHLERPLHLFNERWSDFEQNISTFVTQKDQCGEGATLLGRDAGQYTTYGTIPATSDVQASPRSLSGRLFAVSIVSLLLLWMAQWLFWAGLLSLTAEPFCPPKLGLLTALWAGSSLVSAAVWVL